MKDAIYSGPDVDAALAAASRALGLPADKLRFVVLQEPTPGRLGLAAQPARVAILMDSGRPSAGPAAAEAPAPPEEQPELPVQIADLGRELAEATGLQIALSVGERDGRLEVKAEGAGATEFLAGEGVHDALEHVLRRWAERAGEDLVIAGASHRERRDEALRQKALQLADEVKVDGQPRRLEGLNSYERRIVHMTLQEMVGIETFSVGEGAGRRVVIAPRVSTVED